MEAINTPIWYYNPTFLKYTRAPWITTLLTIIQMLKSSINYPIKNKGKLTVSIGYGEENLWLEV